MPRRKMATDASKLKQGRGLGHGKDYIPYLTVREVPSKGLRHREPGWKTGRVHHCLSNGEDNCLMVFEWCQRIVDIREQFPLQQEDTIEIADRLGITHPKKPGTDDLTVMTTDFVLDVLVEGRIVMVARTVKLSPDLNDFRVIEKLEIERTYWRERRVDWGIITPDRDFPKNLANNVAWVHRAFYSTDAPCGLTEKLIRLVEETLYGQIGTQKTTPLSHVALALDERLGLPSGGCLWVVKHLIATLKWHVDMNQKLTPDSPLEVVERSLLQVESVDA